jgi:hypothetical protein
MVDPIRLALCRTRPLLPPAPVVFLTTGRRAVAGSVWAAWVAQALGGRVWNGAVSCEQGRSDREAMPCR